MAQKSYYVARLRFLSGLHLALDRDGNYDVSDDRLRSDTLLSALYACALELELARPGEQTFFNRYRLSSAFPFYLPDGSHQPVYFFPRPLEPNLNLVFDKPGPDDRKRKARVEYFDKALFERIIAGKQATLSDNSLSKNKRLAASHSIADLKIFDNASFQHVASNEWDIAREPEPYYVDKLFFEENCGLFFLIECAQEDVKDMQACLRLLADNGIGTDRSSGNGAFEWTSEDWDTLQLEVPDNPAGRWMALSLFIPKTEKDMGVLGQAAYELTKRGGYISSSTDEDYALLTIRKKSVYAFEEGSMLQCDDAPEGQIVDLRPNESLLNNKEQKTALHPVYRSGRALFIPTAL